MRRPKSKWYLVALVVTSLWFLYNFAPRRRTFSQLEAPDGFFYFEAQKPYLKYSRESDSYKIAIVADKDKRSKNSEQGHWESLLKSGRLRRDSSTGRYTVEWSDEVTLASKLAEDGRAMELSELVWFHGKLYAPDDRTGVVFSIEDSKAIPRFILMDGDGKSSKGFKTEWATVKDGLLYLGSIGKEWSDSNGKLINSNPQWIKTIDKDGKIEHIDWREHYQNMRRATGAQHPGYLMHEAAAWNPVLKKWFFLPRRFSTEPYDDAKDEERGTNLVITMDENFDNINVSTIGAHTRTRGFSSLVFLPGREEELVALKSEEFGDTIASYIMVLNVVTGDVLMEEEYVGNVKFEGIEVL